MAEKAIKDGMGIGQDKGKSMKDGGPAFPMAVDCSPGTRTEYQIGMSLRDAFAIAALQGAVFQQYRHGPEFGYLTRESIAAGIPEKMINLVAFIRGEPSPHNCETVACIGGWAAMYPPFKEMGQEGLPIYLWFEGSYACAIFFDVPGETFTFKFRHERGTHKQVALRRLDRLLKGN